jgi:uncharacterized membrane protein YfhO
VKWRPGLVEVEVDARRAGVLVLHDTYYPGWIAEIDGKRVPILRADVLFRGVELAPGNHKVLFRFAPLSIENLAATLARVTGGRPRLRPLSPSGAVHALLPR